MLKILIQQLKKELNSWTFQGESYAEVLSRNELFECRLQSLVPTLFGMHEMINILAWLIMHNLDGRCLAKTPWHDAKAKI